MKVALVGMNVDFNTAAGSGIKKYMYELYTHLAANSQIDINKVEFTKTKIWPISRFDWLNNFISFGIKFQLYNFNDYDIVHNPDPGHPVFIHSSKYKLVTTVHDFREFFNPEVTLGDNPSFKYKVYVSLIKKSLYYALKSSDYLIARSTQTKEEAIKLGYPKNRIYISPHGLDDVFIRKKIAKKSKNKKRYVVGYIGGLTYSKNIKFAIDAIGSISDNEVIFNIFGPNRLSNDIENEISKHDKVNFMGFAPEDKKVEIYDSFNVFVFPSLYEGLGLPIREAQARGLPVIIYKYGKIPKEVRKYCFEAESPEHMAQIIEELKKNGYNEKERKKAMEYARSFTWEKIVRDTIEVYKKVLK